MLELLNINQVFKNGKQPAIHALSDVSIKIDDGEFVAVVGTSGAGKSTLLSIMALLKKPTSGQLVINGVESSDLAEIELAKLRNKHIGMVFQEFMLIEELSVLDNVVLPLAIGGGKGATSRRAAADMVARVGLSHHLHQKAALLSGGERQRVAIARALINNAEIILADEPTGNLDSENTQAILKILTNINNRGKTIIIVTHDMDVAKCCKRIITLSDGKVASDERISDGANK